jgi:hypothetical protein
VFISGRRLNKTKKSVMKRVKTFAISISLSLMFSCFTVGLYAGNNYSHLSDTDSYTGIQKVQLTGNKIQDLKLALLVTPDSFEQDYQIDSLMENKDLKKITKPSDFNDESIEESFKAEDCMTNPKPNITPCSNTQSDFIEKTWMKKHSFMIL